MKGRSRLGDTGGYGRAAHPQTAQGLLLPRLPRAAPRGREGFFAALTKRRLKRGVFRSVADLQAAINRYLEDHNADSKPFQWVADPDKIIAAVRRGHQVLDSIHLVVQI